MKLKCMKCKSFPIKRGLSYLVSGWNKINAAGSDANEDIHTDDWCRGLYTDSRGRCVGF